ncbi:scny [Drosophila busckii]|uniref:Ubiquitin carboxyl-terminal hydrolase 36 n=1 Tax=Drosophila busckii TaxID=30019 RepID=A0A0M5JAW6_DROBS|nr:scny [Drosophila busckii]
MPVSLAVCETASIVNSALRESLGVVNVSGCLPAASSRSANGSAKDEAAKNGDDSANDNLQSQIVANAKRVLLAKIDYEESSNGTLHQNGNRKQSLDTAHTNNPNELPKPKRVLYPREQLRIGWKQSERNWQVGAGMINVGNTCYLNSTLQALFHIPALANWLVSETAHVENCNISESCGGTGCIICAMAKTLLSTQSNQSTVRPYLIYSKLRQICKHMIVGRQEDAHEFLRFLVEAMEKAYLMRFRNYKELDQLVKETTPLNQIFGGYLRSEVRCLSCNHVSITFQHFQDLLLDIRKADTLDEAFDGYFSRERLEDMGYKCEGCKKKVSATKQFSLERAPITLCIQLKRFSMMGNKLTKQISFKPRIDLSRFAARSSSSSSSMQPLIYRLVSMVTHLGVSQHCGHYTAIGLTETGSYYNFDDSYVRPSAIQSVCNTNAYIMFYELDVNSVSFNFSSSTVSTAPKMNGTRLGNGQQHSPTTMPSATVTAASPRFIGPQLPNGYGISNGHAKTSLQFKAAATNTTQSAPNKSSCNNNNHNILPISSDDEEEEEDEDTAKSDRPTPQLPSMPKMFAEDEPKLPTVKLKPKSLVPYESASEEEEQQLQPASNPRKRRSGADEDDDSSDMEPETPASTGTLRNGHSNNHSPTKAKYASNATSSLATASHVNSSKQKTDAIEEIFKSLNNYKNKQRSNSKTVAKKVEDEDDDEADQEPQQVNGWQSQKFNVNNGKAPGSPKTPPSPAVIKSKTGIWQVTKSDDADEEEDDDNDEEEDENEAETVTATAKSAKNHKNPFASKATESPPTPSLKRQKLLNGSATATATATTPRIGNGYQSESNANGSAAVSELLKQSHRGYGATVLSWSGKTSELDKELLAEAREQRKRDEEDDEENEMDRGRQRKIKSVASPAVSGKYSNTPGYNPFQEYEGQKRWHNNKSGSFSSRFSHQSSYRSNFQQRNKFKYNQHRFNGGSGGGSAKFQQQRALQRHLASGGGFTRRQHQSNGQQQQQQQS